MAGTADLPVRAFAGMTLGDDELVFTPRLPPHLTRLAFQVRYRGHLLDVDVSGNRLRLHARPGVAPTIRLQVATHRATLSAGQARVFDITPTRGEAAAVQLEIP